MIFNTWTDSLWMHIFQVFIFMTSVQTFFFLFRIFFFFVCLSELFLVGVSHQQQEAPDVSTNELHEGAVLLKNLGVELSVPPSATVPSAQPCEVFIYLFYFCDEGCCNSSEENESRMSIGWQMVDAGNLRISVLPRHSVTQHLCATSILCHLELLLV